MRVPGPSIRQPPLLPRKRIGDGREARIIVLKAEYMLSQSLYPGQVLFRPAGSNIGSSPQRGRLLAGVLLNGAVQRPLDIAACDRFIQRSAHRAKLPPTRT